MDQISLVPNEILLIILEHLDSARDIKNLANASRRFHRALGVELYLVCGRRFNWLPLFIGAERGDIRLLEYCLQLEAPVDTLWICDGYPTYRPLLTAVLAGHPSAVTCLLSHKANPNGLVLQGINPEFRTPLHGCIDSHPYLPAQPQIFRALLASGANQHSGDPCILTKAFSLAYNGSGVQYLSLLLAYKADSSRLCERKNRPHYCYLHPSRLGSKIEDKERRVFCKPPNTGRGVEKVDRAIKQMENCQITREFLSDSEFAVGRNCLITVRRLMEFDKALHDMILNRRYLAELWERPRLGGGNLLSRRRLGE